MDGSLGEKGGGLPVVACLACEQNAAADVGEDPYAVARLRTGWVRLNPNQYFVGATFFASHACVPELHDLDRATRLAHLQEMADVAAAVMSAFGPRKLNYELLGNGCPHLHWWLTPRYASDPRPIGPIWEDLEFLRAQWTDAARPSDEDRTARRRKLLDGLRDQAVVIEVACA
jgi:diadenosine tetraphosphate (Ap4A) HIT family hydrolase